MSSEIWSDFLTIDGTIYNIKVKVGVKRTADFLDKYATRVESGDLQRELIGVYYNYDNIDFEKQTDDNYSEYEKLYNKLTEAEEFHDIVIGNYEFRAYFSNVSDQMYKYKDGKPYFESLTVKFTAKKPARS